MHDKFTVLQNFVNKEPRQKHIHISNQSLPTDFKQMIFIGFPLRIYCTGTFVLKLRENYYTDEKKKTKPNNTKSHSWLLQLSLEKQNCVQKELLPPGPFFLLFLVFFLFESSANASAAFCSLVTKYSMSSKMWFRICYGRKEK